MNILMENNGTYKEYYYNDNIKLEYEYLAGKKNGKYKEYYDNGRIKYECEYIDGEKIGKGIEYYENGKIKRDYGKQIETENGSYTTYIDAINKRGNIDKYYYYKIRGSNEGTVWGDHIYSDDSNISKAAVLEGICEIGKEKIVKIKMIEGKSSYSSTSRNGVSSNSWGSWYCSYIFIHE